MGKVIAILLQACCRYEEGDQLMEGGVYWNADEEGDELLECLRMNEEDIRDKEYNWTRFERYKMYQHDIRDQRRHTEERKFSRRTPPRQPAPRRRRMQLDVINARGAR